MIRLQPLASHSLGSWSLIICMTLGKAAPPLSFPICELGRCQWDLSQGVAEKTEVLRTGSGTQQAPLGLLLLLLRRS